MNADISVVLEKVFRDATDPIIIEDLDGVVIDMNVVAERDYGWPREDLIGKPIKHVVPEWRHEQADSLLDECVGGREVRNIRGVRVARDGREIRILLTLSLLKSDDGMPLAVASYAKDISELTSSQAELTRLSKVFMDATDAIIIEDLEGVVIDLNNAAVAEYGYARDELIGHSITKLIPDWRHDQANDLLRRCIAGETVQNVDGVRVSKAGDERQMLLTLSVLKDEDGQPVAVASYAKDITDLRRLEEEQRVARESVIASQAEAIMQLSTPVTELWSGILLLPVVGIVDSRRAQDIMNAALEKVSEARASRFILDISGVPVVDTAVANNLIKVTQATRLMGCECTISGLSPAIAQTMVELGVDVGRVKTTATLRDALVDAFRETGIQVSAGR